MAQNATDPQDDSSPSAKETRKIMPRHRRQAMRRAKAMGLTPKDGDEAIELLKTRGIDVFALQDSILDIARAEKKKEEQAAGQLVQAEPTSLTAATPTQPQSADERDREVLKIRKGLVKRRRRRLQLLMLRLIAFVLIPTAIAGYYYYALATDMYETQSAFVIQTSEAGGGGGLGSLFTGTGFATSQDSIVVQEYLTSREAFLRLDADHDYLAHFQAAGIDDLQRLAPDASLDAAYSLYKRNTTIGYDPSEGVIRMGVVARTADASQTFSEALVGYAEERVDGLTQEARGDQMDGAEARYEEAEADMLAAQQRVLELQQMRGVLSADAEITSQMAIINSLELEAETKRLNLAEINDNPSPNQIRAQVLQREIERIYQRVAELRSELTEATDTTVSLARISAELRIAETELATRQAILQQSLVAVETARIEANKQVRYLSLGVAPVAPEGATYPKKLEGTLLAFLIFSSIYIVVSLTVSILREQVSV